MALRRLWDSCKTLSIEDQKDFISGGTRGVPRRPLGGSVLRAMTEDAHETGLPEMTTPTTPGPLTLTKIANIPVYKKGSNKDCESDTMIQVYAYSNRETNAQLIFLKLTARRGTKSPPEL